MNLWHFVVRCTGLVAWLMPSVALATSQVEPGLEQAPAQRARALRPVSFELAALGGLEPRLYELPLELHGGRATLGARVVVSEHFSYAPQLLGEHYRGSTPAGLTVTAGHVSLLLDVSIGLPWLHWELFVGKGYNSMQRATGGDMWRGQDVVGISVSPEWRITDHAHLFALLGQRWLGDMETTVLGVGFRM